MYFTELADNDPGRIGIGLSRLAETLQAAGNRFQHDENLRRMLKEEIVSKVDKAYKELEKPLAILNGGKTGKVSAALVSLLLPCVSGDMRTHADA